jgi:hypothetical protein
VEPAAATSAEQNSPAIELPTITLAVKILSGRTIQIVIRGSATIDELRAAICTSTNVPIEQIRLIFAGRQLEPSRTLFDYGITHEHTVHMVSKLSYPKPLMHAIANINQYQIRLREFMVGYNSSPAHIAVKLTGAVAVVDELVRAGRTSDSDDDAQQNHQQLHRWMEATILLKMVTMLPYHIVTKIFELVVLTQWSEAKLHAKNKFTMSLETNIPVYTSYGSTLDHMYGFPLGFLL